MKNTLFILTLLFSACGKQSSETKTRAPINAIEQKRTLNVENFNSFFERFKTDSIFQVERTRFPLKIISWNDEYNQVTETINMKDWRHLSFEYDDSYATRETDAYTQEIKAYGDSTKVELRGVDNGIHIDYNFAKTDGQWYLLSEKDFSN